ncbi:hypothetical protein A2696_01370 [Candidatus Curtissbacteria bacterium RIFCSPHIGHO2_01_FULL_41_13]|uniref:Glycosyl transferase family 1 domain-containing protein n=1 Tax=Candidatus Curtissbacteria bacterium RIFCSPHIGHO2_01_FULL_41_13 TaxID=1797745 RepID=A0A1F5FY03_9BACT|nr:MAG: hypothetical protein A2696_01370 [Candidatus Curtissbacteria bacterium RIFCSPHIGHO2_01_FULL_41_13]
MKVALVHDFLIEYGGAERVLEALHEIWPKAPVYCAFYDPDALGDQSKRFANWKVITSWGTRLPFWRKLVSPYRIFSKSFFESFDLSSFDLVISSNAMYMAKAVKVPNGVHICYCHTPPRFLYGYPTAMNWRKNLILRPIGEVINHVMRVWDFEAAQKPASTRGESTRGGVDYFIANSCEVAARIKKFYRRDSTVIYPPVDVGKFAGPAARFPRPTSLLRTNLDIKSKISSDAAGARRGSPTRVTRNGGYFLVVSRLVASKNVDVVVEVCAKLGLQLKVVGAGREMENLKKIAKEFDNGESTVEFVGDVSDDELIGLYQNCRAVIFAASQEDFGLVPVEAMAAGKPVIVNAEGGVLESVIDASAGSAQVGKMKGKCTGVYFELVRNKPSYFDPATAGSLTLAINNFINLEKKGYFDAKFIQAHAQKFSKERFKRQILKFVGSKIK